MPDTKKYMKSIKFGTQGDTYYVKDEEAVAKQQDPQDAGKVLTIGQDGVVVPAAGGGTGAVSSVNGKTGAVVLTSTDVDAADAGQFSAHVNNDNIHVSTEDRQNWNGKADNSALTDHTGDTTIHVTSSDKTTWSGKQDKLTSANAGTNVTITEESGVVKINATGGSGGTTNYNDLTNKPAIDGTTLASDSTAAGLGLAKTTDVYTKAEADSEFLSSPSEVSISDTAVTMATLDYNKIYTCTNPITSLTVTAFGATDTNLETVLYFTTDTTFTMTLPVGTKYSPLQPIMRPETSYVMSVKNGIVVIGTIV